MWRVLPWSDILVQGVIAVAVHIDLSDFFDVHLLAPDGIRNALGLLDRPLVDLKLLRDADLLAYLDPLLAHRGH